MVALGLLEENVAAVKKPGEVEIRVGCFLVVTKTANSNSTWKDEFDLAHSLRAQFLWLGVLPAAVLGSWPWAGAENDEQLPSLISFYSAWDPSLGNGATQPTSVILILKIPPRQAHGFVPMMVLNPTRVTVKINRPKC